MVNNSSLISILEEQIAFEFTGRVNIFRKSALKSNFIREAGTSPSAPSLDDTNDLMNHSSQLLGIIIFKNGQLTHAKYKKYQGIVALEEIISDEKRDNQQELKYEMEPEIVDDFNQTINEESNLLISKLADFYTKPARNAQIIPFNQNIGEQKEEFPPSFSISLEEIYKYKKIILNPEFIWEGEEITPEEFDLMLIISEYADISDIVKHSPLTYAGTAKEIGSLHEKKGVLIK